MRVCLWLCVLLATSASAQFLDLGGGDTPPAQVQLGDTLHVSIRVHTEGRSLTSAGWALQYDAAVLRPVDSAYQLDPIFFPQAVIYQNDAIPFSGMSRARFVAVSGTGSGGTRTAMTGTGVPARIGFVVVGLADSARIDLVASGADRPRFTEDGRPGVERTFGIAEPSYLHVDLDHAGFLAPAPIELTAGSSVAIGLRGRSAIDDVRWSVGSSLPGLVRAVVDGDSLRLSARPRVAGSASIDYSVATSDGAAVSAGTFAVGIMPGIQRLQDPRLVGSEDGGPLLADLGDYLVDGVDMPEGATWEIGADGPLNTTVQGSLLRIEAPADWWGTAAYTVRLRQGAVLLDTLRASIVVESINDSPRLSPPVASLRAVQGARVVGPRWADWVEDDDDELSDLRLAVSGDGVDAWVEDGRLHLRGLRAGAGWITLRVTDPAGASAEAIVPVEVEATAAAPTLLLAGTLSVTRDQPLRLSLSSVVFDADTPVGELAFDVLTEGITAAIESDSLILRASEIGTGTLQLTVSDNDDNRATGVWWVTVVEPPRPAADVEPVTDDVGAVGHVVETEPDGVALSFQRPSALRLQAGESLELDVASWVRPAHAASAFSVVGGRRVETVLDESSGRLRVTAGEASDGREVLLLTAVAADGAVASTTLEVFVSAVQRPGAMRLQRLPEVILESGGETVLDLDAFVSGADGQIDWSARTDDELVETEISGRLLRVRAGGGAGRTSILVVAEDASQRRASEVIPVEVQGRIAQVASPVRFVAPQNATMTAGQDVEIVLDDLVIGADSSVDWHISESGGLHAEMDAGHLRLAADADATPGWHTVILLAQTDSGVVPVQFQVAVAAAPSLVLRTPAPMTVTAGLSARLPAGSLVSVGAIEAIDWQVEGGVLLQASIDNGHLQIDATRALPGREVLRVRAALGLEVRHVSLPVVIRMPVASAAVDTVRLGKDGVARLDIDRWVQGEISPALLSWTVLNQPDGVTARWDPEQRMLLVNGDTSGDLELAAQLPSGLRILKATWPLAVVAAVEPLDPPDVQPPVDAASWALRAPTVSTASALDTLRLPLATLVDGADVADLDWSIEAVGSGAGLIGGGVVELWGERDFTVIITAAHLREASRDTLQLRVPVQQLVVSTAPVPIVRLSWELRDAGIEILAAGDADATLLLQPRPDGTWLPIEHDRPTLLPIADQDRLLEVRAIAQRGSAVGTTALRLQVGRLVRGGRLVSADGQVAVDVASEGPVTLAMSPMGEDGSVDVAQAGAEASLALQFADGEHRWTAVEQHNESGWQALPAVSRSTHGITGFIRVEGGRAAFRPAVAADIEPETTGPFPNPFNASVVLPFPEGGGTLRIYDGIGRIVRQVDVPGSIAMWDGRDQSGRRVASGVYYYRLISAGQPVAGRMTLLR